MDAKLEASVPKYRRRVDEINGAKRLTRIMGPEDEEQLMPGGKRLRVIPTCPKLEVPSMLEVDLLLSDSDDDTPITICEYKVGRGSISLFPADMERLNGNHFLNDNLIDVILAWLADEELANGRRADSLICSSHLFTQMIRGVTQFTTPAADKQLQANFTRLSRWFPDDGPWNKSTVFIPVCDKNHWLLVVVVTDSKHEAITILLMDSMAHTSNNRAYIVQVVSKFLQFKLPSAYIVSYQIKVIQQQNNFDCGLHLLTNAQRFMQHTRTYPDTTEEQLEQTLNATPCPVSREDVKRWVKRISHCQRDSKPQSGPVESDTKTTGDTLVIYPGTHGQINKELRAVNETQEIVQLEASDLSEIMKQTHSTTLQGSRRKRFKSVVNGRKMTFKLNPSTRCWTITLVAR